MNNCQTCEYKKFPQGGHCYMFREEPKETCRQHRIDFVIQPLSFTPPSIGKNEK